MRRWAVEIKWSRVPRPTKGFLVGAGPDFAREALAPDRCFLVGAGPDHAFGDTKSRRKSGTCRKPMDQPSTKDSASHGALRQAAGGR